MKDGAGVAGSSVLVVGGSSGIGLATARLALEAGAQVAIAGRSSERLAEAVSALGDSVRSFAVDARDADQVRRLFEELGALTHAVVLSGEQPIGEVADTDLGYFRQAMDARFWGALHVCRYGGPVIEPGGSVTLCSGVIAHRPVPGRSLGTASTAAVEAFGRAMARELSPVRVNTIVPGPIDTPMLRRFFGGDDAELQRRLEGRVPVGRVGRPEEVADAILFLMGNRFVTGVTLPVDGGFLLSS
jgi:NAD(P)-dependent dehydrogenase (short-subunit alcohol dehydrogenase family)